MFNSSVYLEEFYNRISKQCAALTDDFEIILVNDGSPDDSLAVAVALQKTRKNIAIVDLSRNFGHHHAILAGLHHVSGDMIFLIDIDLEEQPEWLEIFWQKYQQTGADVIYGIQEAREGRPVNRYMVGLFYYFFNKMSDVTIPRNPCTVRLMSCAYVKAILRLQEKNLFLGGTFSWVGFNQQPVIVKKQPRTGRSNYTFQKMVALLFNAVSSFSSYPLTMIFFIGLFIATLSGFVGCGMVLYKIFSPDSIQLGWPSLMVSIWFLGGMVIFFIGVIGLYLAKVFQEVKARPQFIVKKIHKQDNS